MIEYKEPSRERLTWWVEIHRMGFEESGRWTNQGYEVV